MRIFRLIATPVLLLGLLALLAWGAFWGWRNLTAPLPTPEPTPCVVVTKDPVTAADVYVRVFNGGFTSGLAYREAQRLEQAGYNIIRTGNTDERIKGTIIRANESNQTGVRLVASQFKDATIEYDDRVDGTVDVMVGTEFAGPGEKPLFQVSSGDGTICIPPAPTPSATAASSPTASPES